MTTYFTGDTVRFKSTFEDLDENLVDADGNVTFTIYDTSATVFATGTAIRESLGVYYYDYTFSTTAGSWTVEMGGDFSTKPQLQRMSVKTKFKA